MSETCAFCGETMSYSKLKDFTVSGVTPDGRAYYDTLFVCDVCDDYGRNQ